MARPGISYNEVAEAAVELMGQGRNPTVEQIRLKLGTGSSTTVAKHLRQWKSNQEATSLISTKENIPAELVAVMKGLWEQVLNHSQEKINSVETSYQQTIAKLEQELEKYKTNNNRWQKLFNQWQQEKTQLQKENMTLDQALEFSHKENASLHAKQDGLMQQLQDKQVRIDELHRFHKQAQENLEHYRESAREQRLLDQQQYERDKQQLQFEIKNLNEHLTKQREDYLSLQQQNHQLTKSNATLEKDLEHAHSRIDKIKTKLEETEIEKNTFQQSSLHFQNQFNERQKSLENKILEFNLIQTEIKILSQQLSDNKALLQDAHSQNKLLANDKWALAQEKAQLEGQLKQMQKMITA